MDELSPCQKKAFDRLRGDENVFLTGGAGTGKSYLVREFLRHKSSKTFPVLASTGAAAVLVGGRTFHSFLGLGIMEGGALQTIDRALKNKRVVRRLRQIEGFIIDEVSMISGPTLAAAESICRRARDAKEPWGGLRVVAVGDFAQLPPVQRFNTQQRDWAFSNPSWEFSDFKTSVLKTMMRTQDEEFLQVLARIRVGVVDEVVTEYLTSRCIDPSEEYLGPRLFPRKDAVQKYNLQKLNELETEERQYITTYQGKKERIEQLKKSSPIDGVLKLKKDCLIMLRQNDPKQRWVNGSLGYVRDMLDDILLIELMSGRLIELEKSTFSLQDADGEVVAIAENFPVSLAYATTIHKAQGATFDRLRVDLKRLWEPGQAYVALSRVTSGDAFCLDGWNKESIKVDPRVTRFYQNALQRETQV